MTASMKPKSSASRARRRLLPAMQARRAYVIVRVERRTSILEDNMESIAYPDAELVEDTNGEEVRIQSWRAEQLRRLGLSNILAEAFASHVDWHDIAALVARGCPPELALEIAR